MADARRPRIFYRIPEHAEPSWGVALLHGHVRLLRQLGRQVQVLGAVAAPGWLEPSLGAAAPTEAEAPAVPEPEDVIVVPEVLATEPADCGWAGRRVVFVQGAYLVHPNLGGRSDYSELGFERAIAVLPHVRDVVERHFGVPASVVPPFLAPYMFDGDAGSPRERRILAFPKPGYAAAGFSDYETGLALIRRRLRRRHPSWKLQEVEGVSHREVARLMRESELMVSFNSLEAFNTTVPEGMASGCLPFCYAGIGARDFLTHGSDGFAFETHDLFALVDSLDDLLGHFEERSGEIARMRKTARATAARFTEDATSRALNDFFGQLLDR